MGIILLAVVIFFFWQPKGKKASAPDQIVRYCMSEKFLQHTD